MSGHKYDNEVHENNKFGHTLTLLERNLPEGVAGVHLDLACGFGHIADHIAERFGLEYVGVDIDDQELEQLRVRGYEAHAADLSSPSVGKVLTEIIGDRVLASVTFLDGLEHMTDGSDVLAAIGDLVAQHRAIAVTSVPNVTHIDIGVKTLLGRWDYTPAGLLDETHYTLYSHDSLLQAFRAAGLRPVDRNDVVVAISDQRFPDDHVGLSSATSLNQWLRHIRSSAEPNHLVQQFVWALTAAPRMESVPGPVEQPFLSVIMRTQGRRQQELREALLCLAAQTCTDFEVILVAHRTSYEEQVTIERVLADQMPSFRERIRLVLLDRGRRATPLNVGLEAAHGTYVAIFDDDDTVMASWVAEFKAASRDHMGRLLRAVTLVQQVENVAVNGQPGVRSIDAPQAIYSEEFSLVEHVHRNQSPPIGWVFPRSIHRDFGLTFDESMTTTEDWEFLMRCAQLTGVTDTGSVAAIYRLWPNRESSRTLHPVHEWVQNEVEIQRRADAVPMLLQTGDTRVLRDKLRKLDEAESLAKGQAEEIALLKLQVSRLRERNVRLRTRVEKLRGRIGPDGDEGPVSRPLLRRVRRRLKLRTRARALYARVGGQ